MNQKTVGAMAGAIRGGMKGGPLGAVLGGITGAAGAGTSLSDKIANTGTALSDVEKLRTQNEALPNNNLGDVEKLRTQNEMLYMTPEDKENIILGIDNGYGLWG